MNNYAVSKLTNKTSTENEADTELYLEGGKIIEASKSDARQGTEITVEQLFYNTPARLKYMRTIYTELGHITDLVNRYALAHPHVRFEVVHNEKNKIGRASCREKVKRYAEAGAGNNK